MRLQDTPYYLLILATIVGCAAADTSSGPDGSVVVVPDAPPTTADATPIDFDAAPSFDASPSFDATPSGTLTVAAPNGGESLMGGDSIMVLWSSSGSVGPVDIELHKAGSKVLDIIGGAANTGSWPWTVPIDMEAGADYTVVVKDSAVPALSDESNANFSVLNWQYRTPVIFSSGTARTDYAMLLELSSANFNYANARSDGGDLRFASDDIRSNGFDIPYYIESWNTAGTSRVWLLVPTLTAGGSDTVHLFHGNPFANPVSDLDATFPSQYISSDGETLNASYDVGLFRVQTGHTVFTPSGTAAVVTARLIEIAGTIDGVGRGSAGGLTAGGSGPGAGGGSTNSGGGGGGYGGAGGLGGYDATDTPGTAGPTAGSTTSVAILMGSGGGGPSDNVGGNGGGAITLRGRHVAVTGTIDCSGTDGILPSTGTGRGSGGGSGGGILVVGHDLVASGTLRALGGLGGTSTSTFNDGGGGGGGGRIKLFYQSSLGSIVNTATLTVTGGAGGNFGDTASGANGLGGTTRVSTTAVGEPSVIVASQIALY